jgi:hypothetical protein
MSSPTLLAYAGSRGRFGNDEIYLTKSKDLAPLADNPNIIIKFWSADRGNKEEDD